MDPQERQMDARDREYAIEAGADRQEWPGKMVHKTSVQQHRIARRPVGASSPNPPPVPPKDPPAARARQPRRAPMYNDLLSGARCATRHIGVLTQINTDLANSVTDDKESSRRAARSSPNGFQNYVLTPGLSKSPESPANSIYMRTISRDPNGRFRMEGIETLQLRPYSPQTNPFSEEHQPRRSSHHAQRPVTPAMSHRSSGPCSPSTPTRRTEPTGRQQNGRRRRHGSFREFARRASQELKKDVMIMSMDEDERRKWERDMKERMDDEIEEARRKDPASRPQYQQEYILRRDHTAAIPPKVFLDAGERARAADLTRATNLDEVVCCEAEAEMAAKPILGAGERFAIAISRATDRWKKQDRKHSIDSDDSGMDFADCAPPGYLEECKRCGRELEGREYTTRSMCEKCLLLARQATIHSSPSGQERCVDEDGYVKVVASKHIRRIRQTIYEDPGNPFMDEFEELVHDARRPVSISLSTAEARRAAEPGHARCEIVQVDQLLNASKVCRTGTRAVRRCFVRNENGSFETMPRALWEELKEESRSPPPDPALSPRRGGGGRDAKAYEFYDDILKEYDGSAGYI